MSRSLNDKIGDYPDILTMLRNAPIGFYQFPVPDEHTNWRSEQSAWQKGAVLFDQSYHMTDLYISGPDKIRLLSEFSINNYTEFDAMKAVQIVVCSDGGHIVGDSIVFHLQDGELNLVGKPSCANFIEYAAETGKFDVTLHKDVRKLEGSNARETFRFQLQGPNAFRLLEEVNGAPLPNPGFFGMCEFEISGYRVTGLRHGMASAPGMEFWGPYGNREAVLAALVGPIV